MTTPQPAALATAYLRALCADLRGVVVVAADGTPLDGDPEMASLLAAGGADDTVHVARDERHAVAVRTGDRALRGVIALDLAAALAILANG